MLSTSCSARRADSKNQISFRFRVIHVRELLRVFFYFYIGATASTGGFGVQDPDFWNLWIRISLGDSFEFWVLNSLDDIAHTKMGPLERNHKRQKSAAAT